MFLFYNFSCTKRFQLGVYYSIKGLISEILIDVEIQEDSDIILLKIDLQERDIRDFIVASKVIAQYIYESSDDGINPNIKTYNKLLDWIVIRQIKN